MPTLTPPTPTSADVDAAADAAQERLTAAQQAIARLHAEAGQLNATFDAALEANDRAGLATARTRHAEIADEFLIHQRAIVSARLALADVAVEAGQRRLDAANGAFDATLQAEQAGVVQARERRLQDVEDGTLYKWRYNEAMESDTYDLRQDRERATRAVQAAKFALMDLQQQRAQAHAALDAHRRRDWLHLDHND